MKLKWQCHRTGCSLVYILSGMLLCHRGWVKLLTQRLSGPQSRKYPLSGPCRKNSALGLDRLFCTYEDSGGCGTFHPKPLTLSPWNEKHQGVKQAQEFQSLLAGALFFSELSSQHCPSNIILCACWNEALLFFLFFTVLGIEPGASCLLGECFTSELQPQSVFCLFVVWWWLSFSNFESGSH